MKKLLLLAAIAAGLQVTQAQGRDLRCSSGYKVTSKGFTGYRCSGDRKPLRLSCSAGFKAGKLRNKPALAENNYSYRCSENS